MSFGSVEINENRKLTWNHTFGLVQTCPMCKATISLSKIFGMPDTTLIGMDHTV